MYKPVPVPKRPKEGIPHLRSCLQSGWEMRDNQAVVDAYPCHLQSPSDNKISGGCPFSLTDELVSPMFGIIPKSSFEPEEADVLTATRSGPATENTPG